MLKKESLRKKSLINLEHNRNEVLPMQSFPSDNTAGVFSRTFIVKNISKFFDANCGLFMRLHFTIGYYDRRRTFGRRQKYPFQHYSSPVC